MNEPSRTTPRARVEYALETVSPERTATISARDLLFILKSLREFTTFFSPYSPPDRAAIQSFLWGIETGAFGALEEAFDKCFSALPPDIYSEWCDGQFDLSEQPR